jgi:hypothetical protein
MAACCLLILLVDLTKNQNKIKIAVEKLELWKEFSSRMTILSDSVPLFSISPGGLVNTKNLGKEHQRQVLARDPRMEALQE